MNPNNDKYTDDMTQDGHYQYNHPSNYNSSTTPSGGFKSSEDPSARSSSKEAAKNTGGTQKIVK